MKLRIKAIIAAIPAIIRLTCNANAAIATELKVKILETSQPIQIGSSTDAIAHNGQNRLGSIKGGTKIAINRQGRSVRFDKQLAAPLYVKPSENGLIWIQNRWYRGEVQLIPTPRGIAAVNIVELEEYLPSVVGKEMSASWPLEALKAQAVAARTYALYKQNTSRSRRSYYDLVNTTQDQVYQGVQAESAKTIAAVQSTQGVVMTHSGRVIFAAYHACSGGKTKNSEQVWGGYLPYLRSRTDFDQGIPACVPGRGFGPVSYTHLTLL